MANTYTLRVGPPSEWDIVNFGILAESGGFSVAGSDVGLDKQNPPQVIAAQAGIYTITGHDAQLVASAPGQWRGNEPAGFTELTDRQFLQTTELGWGSQSLYGTFSVESGHDSPSGDAQVGVMSYPSGFPGGQSPGNTWYTPSPKPMDLYACFYHKISTSFEASANGANKVMFIVDHTSTNGGGDPFYLNMKAMTATTYQYEGRQQGPVKTQNFSTNLASEVVNKDEWALVEVLLRAQNSAGSSDGEIHIWVNGTKTTEHTDVEWSPAGAARTHSTKWDPVWGAIGQTSTGAFYQYMDRFYVSGAFS